VAEHNNTRREFLHTTLTGAALGLGGAPGAGEGDSKGLPTRALGKTATTTEILRNSEFFGFFLTPARGRVTYYNPTFS
jgi:hypothetical protein